MSNKSLIYVGDPMCSWCYGFGVPLQALLQSLPEVPLNLVLGGLRAYNKEVMPDNLKATIHQHWDAVHKRSGKPFGTGQFDRAGYIYDTEPACRAVVTIRNLAPSQTLVMYHAVQHAFYALGHDITQTQVLADIWQGIQTLQANKVPPQAFLTRDEFVAAFESDKMKMLTHVDFEQVQQWGIQGFPALIAVNGEQGHMVANGYMEATDMLQRVQAVFDGT